MKQSVDLYTFRQAFEELRPANFSRDGLAVLFDCLEQLELDLGEELELDVIAICCDYSEDSPHVIAEQYSIDLNEADQEDDDYEQQCIELVKDWLQDNGAYVGETDNSLIYNVNF